MTRDEFRKCVRATKGIAIAELMGCELMFVGDATIGTLGWPDAGHALVHLSSTDQQNFVLSASHVFGAQGGGSGKKGATIVVLRNLDADAAQRVIVAAIRHAATELERRHGSERSHRRRVRSN